MKPPHESHLVERNKWLVCPACLHKTDYMDAYELHAPACALEPQWSKDRRAEFRRTETPTRATLEREIVESAIALHDDGGVAGDHARLFAAVEALAKRGNARVPGDPL